MKQYRFDTSIEPMISRIPSMFAYLEFNDDWTTTLHPASDSPNGSWGKVVENITLPCGINLYTYVIAEEPTPYLWNEGNTFPTNVDIENGYTINASEYIRRVEGCQYVDEEYNRLYTYTEYDSFPEEVTTGMPERIKSPELDRLGNYVMNCDGNKIYKYYHKEVSYIYYKKQHLLLEGSTYTYRTLIDYYYRYKDILPAGHNFIVFMEKAIGKVKVDKGLLHMEDYSNVPDYLYLGYVKLMIEKYKKYHRICEYYRTHFINLGKHDDKLFEKCKYYESIGGDKFLKYLETLLRTLNKVAAEYFCYAEHADHQLQISVNVPLFQTKNDLGYLSTYLNEFSPGIHVRHGELVTYNGRTYICVLNRFQTGGVNYQYCLCNGDLYVLSANTYNKVGFGKVLLPTLPLVIYNGNTFIMFAGEYYMWSNGEYKKIDVVEYCSGKWNENLEVNEFDTQHFVLLSEYTSKNASALSIPEKSALSMSDEWYNQDNAYGNHFQIYITVSHIPQHFIYKNIKKGDVFYIWDDENQMYIVDTTNTAFYEVSGKSDSVLRSLRKYQDFMDSSNLFDEPDGYEDWLYYYKIGNYYSDRGILQDSIGNIQRFTDTPPTIGQYDTDLKAYGTILTDVQCDTVARTLTFTYVANAHLKAVLTAIETDDDGNLKYHYGAFEYDESDSHGVKYIETYNYFDTDIDELVNNGDFQAFVEDRIEDISDYMMKYGYKRFRFSVMNNTASITLGANDYEYPYVLSEYNETVENELDYIYQGLFKRDYFTGYAYEPTVDNQTNIRRGNAATYERHFRLGECKTIDDLENSQNSGFYSFME